MALPISASLATDFDASAPQVGLQLALDDKLGLAPPGGFRIRLYPPVPARVYASAPTRPPVLTSEVRVHQRPLEVVEFADTDRARAEYPITNLYTVTFPQTLFKQTDSGLTPVTFAPSAVTVDPDTHELVLPEKAIGHIVVGYDAHYRIITWVPPRTYNGYYGGVLVEEGKVLAYYNGERASVDITIRREQANRTAVLCEAVSFVVIGNADKFDRYEMPPNFPDDPSYPGTIGAAEPDPNNSAVIDRVHEVWVYDAFGAAWRTMPVLPPTIYKPYAGHATYHPQVGARFASRADEGMEDAFARAITEKAEILRGMAKRYPNWLGDIS